MDLFGVCIGVFSWIVWTVIDAMIARQKGRSVFLTLLAALFFTPIAPYIYLIAVPSKIRFRKYSGEYYSNED
ncbi:MAG: hypothetical protein LBV16_02585 [Elusimicrobiota bacterium]|jgi:hypothetical protein|nr:hypothetical protein [Elusimicrobiota bacterium]